MNFPARKKVRITVEAIAWMALWSAKLEDFPGIGPRDKNNQAKSRSQAGAWERGRVGGEIWVNSPR